MELHIEIINNPLDLEVGDRIIYATNKGLLTARIEKKPEKDPKYPAYFKSTRCKVNVDKHFRVHKNWKGIDVTTNWTVQHFNLEEFNMVKYVRLTERKNILRIIEK